MILQNDGLVSKTAKEKVIPIALKAKVTKGLTSSNSICQDESKEDDDEDEEINLMEKNFRKFSRKETASYILNGVLILKVINKTPYEIHRGKKPSLEYFRVFGYRCVISDSLKNPTLYYPMSYNDIFLGYSQKSKAYTVLNKEILKIKKSLNVTFDDSLPKPRISPLVDDDVIEGHDVQDHDRTQNQNCDLEEVIPRVENIKENRDHPSKMKVGQWPCKRK
nr:retrovirus-related Pol polyprotein from transposon TNT 1-94 [Tanacetum cinerariifolium]